MSDTPRLMHPLLDAVPVPGRTFIRAERCSNCQHFERGPRAVQHFVWLLSKELHAPNLTPALLAMRLYSWTFTRHEKKIHELDAHLSIVPGDVAIIVERDRLLRRLHAMEAGGRLEVCRRVIEAHGEQRALSGGELLAFAALCPDYVFALGLEPEEIRIPNCAIGDRGLCLKGAPSRGDSKGSDFVEGGFKCHLYDPVPGLAPEKGGPDSDLPHEVEQAMDEAAAARTDKETP